MTAAVWVGAVLVLAITAYAWLGLADFGAGFWDFTAGGRQRGRAVRDLIDEVVTPVWEANHVWLIFVLITAWTAFGAAFGPIMTTLFVPLALAALGIVLRGANFALRKDAARAGGRHLAGLLFGIGAVMTPFFLGTALGAIMSARVPADGTGDPVSSWWNPVSIAVGVLAVAAGAFLSAAYLVVEATKRDDSALRSYFQTRAAVAGVAGLLCGVIAGIAMFYQQRQMFDRLVQRSIPLLVLGAVALGATYVMAQRGRTGWLRATAALGVAALVWSWAVAQYPYLLPFSLSISQGAGAAVTLHWVLVWFVVAVLTVVPLLILVLTLDQRGDLGEDPTTSMTPAGPGAE